ncbi:hypothetical protein GCM10009687_07550 [Asanoa iriomotensis]|uniref:Uncharacterized protein n=1 Tax=Asanoa iriomotensis TaxID=234613 RepID=A0ABQ4CF83_9ACTN|nr:hypothetical protein Air01nite_72310 [Asanoa iriomotensis]
MQVKVLAAGSRRVGGFGAGPAAVKGRCGRGSGARGQGSANPKPVLTCSWAAGDAFSSLVLASFWPAAVKGGVGAGAVLVYNGSPTGKPALAYSRTTRRRPPRRSGRPYDPWTLQMTRPRPGG